MEELKPTDNVLIVVPDTHDFHKAYGKVKKVIADQVLVSFGLEFSDLFRYGDTEDKRIEKFDKKEVVKFNPDDHPEIKANLVYGENRYHHLYITTYKFSPENDCICKGCDKKAHKRILFNVWGTVREYDVCEEHAKFDGWCGDSFSVKDNYHPVIIEMCK